MKTNINLRNLSAMRLAQQQQHQWLPRHSRVMILQKWGRIVAPSSYRLHTVRIHPPTTL